MPNLTRIGRISSTWILTGLLILLLFSTLVESKSFILPWLAGYYSYLAITIVLAVIAGIVSLRKDLPQQFNLPVPAVFFALWVFYILLHGELMSEGFNLRHIFSLTTGGLFIASFLLLSSNRIYIQAVFKAIAIIATLEAILCIIQYLGFTHSKSIYFPVTGSWDNPNVTAMFLVMASPVFIPTLFNQKAVFRKFIYSAIGLTALALVLLNCRTAYIGLGILLFILLQFKYNWLGRINRRNVLASAWRVIGVTVLVVIACTVLYQSKKNSADGRLLVYKVSMNMIVEKPLTGYGYGSFERNYNLTQAEYIRSGKASPEELQNAGFVRMGYNEYLESGVEGGVVGFILFTGMIISLLITLPAIDRNDKAALLVQCAYAGLAAFAVMSVVNFSLRSIPLMYLFTIYSALLCNYVAVKPQIKRRIALSVRTRTVFKLAMAFCLIAGASWLFISQYRLPYANYQNKQAFDMANKGQFKPAIKILERIKNTIPDHDTFLKNYGKVLMATGDYRQAIIYFNKTKAYTSDSELFLLSGECYYQLNHFDNAANEFKQASYLEPQRFLPRMALLNVYCKVRDTAKAINTALSVWQLKPKVPSKLADQYKASARQVLVQLKYPLTALEPELTLKKAMAYPAPLLNK